MWHTWPEEQTQCPLSPRTLQSSRSNSTNDWSPLIAPRLAQKPAKTPAGQEDKRRAQNRAAQRAFRSRKKTHQSHLESQVWLSELAVAELKTVKADLAKSLCRVEVENVSLRASLTDSNAKRMTDLNHSLRAFDHILDHLHEPGGLVPPNSRSVPQCPTRILYAARVLYPAFKTLWDLAKAYVEPGGEQQAGTTLKETFEFLKEKALAEDQVE